MPLGGNQVPPNKGKGCGGDKDKRQKKRKRGANASLGVKKASPDCETDPVGSKGSQKKEKNHRMGSKNPKGKSMCQKKKTRDGIQPLGESETLISSAI